MACSGSPLAKKYRLAAIPSTTMTMPALRLKSFWMYRLSWPHDTHVVTTLRVTMESFINTGISPLHCGHLMDSMPDGGIAISFSQTRHLKCIIGVMKTLLVMLLLTVTVQAQSIADA